MKNPVPIFEKYALDLKIDEIDDCIAERSAQAYNIIIENLVAVYKIIKKLKDAINQS